jgi:hypothetical protein
VRCGEFVHRFRSTISDGEHLFFRCCTSIGNLFHVVYQSPDGSSSRISAEEALRIDQVDRFVRPQRSTDRNICIE